MKVTIIHLDAGNDRSGNPRRAYLLCAKGLFHLVPEGYDGYNAMAPIAAAMGVHVDTLYKCIVCTICTTPGELRRWQKRSVPSDKFAEIAKGQWLAL